jgi:ketol-acid reductoisomerase
MHCAKNIAVIGHGDRGHAQLVDALDKFFNVASAVEQRIIAMQMQVDELVLGHEAFSESISFYRLE